MGEGVVNESRYLGLLVGTPACHSLVIGGKIVTSIAKEKLRQPLHRRTEDGILAPCRIQGSTACSFHRQSCPVLLPWKKGGTTP